MSLSSLLRRPLLLSASCALLFGTLSCVDGPGTESDSAGTSDPEEEESAEYGTITVRMFDPATDEVLCESTVTSSSTQPDSNYRAAFSYEGLPSRESIIVSGGTVDFEQSEGPIASVSLLLSKASDGVHDLPPSASYEWVTEDVEAGEGFVSCAKTGADAVAGDFISLQFNHEEPDFGLTTLTASVASAEPLKDYEDGWSAALTSGCRSSEYDACQVYGAIGAFSMMAVGTGLNAATLEATRFEVTLDVSRGSVGASREAE